MVTLAAVLPSAFAVSGPQDVIPAPVRCEITGDVYSVRPDGSDVRIHLGDKRFRKEISALNLPVFAQDEAYRLSVGKKGVDIYALSPTGAYRASTTLRMMVGKDSTLLRCSILDYPRFRHRGLMLDISRNFRDKDFILKQLDVMAMLKMSTLHLHLTDDAGWRVQIDAYPELTRKAAWRVGKNYEEWVAGGKEYSSEGAPLASGGYLTKSDVREIVEYAAERHINIIPEIELPGHSGEVLAAYPELSCLGPDGVSHRITGDLCPGKEMTFKMFETILDEVIEMFPYEYVHIGGDEASKRAWKECPDCLHRMESEGLKNVDELQSYLVNRVTRFLESKGRHAIGWDEILDGGLAEGAAVMSWRGTKGGITAAEMGHDVIMSPGDYCYFDSSQDAPFSQPKSFSGYRPLSQVYSFNPTDGIDDEYAGYILGLQANLWSEFVPTGEYMEYLLYPRAFAIAEIGWSPVGNKDYSRFRENAVRLAEDLRSAGYNAFDLKNEIGPRPESLRPLEHLAAGAKLTYNSRKYSGSYPAGGDNALVDGKLGGWFYKDNRWQGFLCDVDVTIDLGAVKDIHYVGATFLSHTSAEVGFPVRTEVSFSEDGVNYSDPVVCLLEIPDNDSCALLHTLGSAVNAKARYIKYKAVRDDVTKHRNHAFIFIDEIVVN